MHSKETERAAALKGLLLSGGHGTRFFPITNTLTKQLLPVANKPVLFSALEDLVAAGITEIGVIISPELGGAVREAVGDGQQFGAHVTYIVQDKPRGVAQTIILAQEFLKGDPFVLYLGDNLLGRGIKEYVSSFSTGASDALILSTPVPDPERYSVVQLDKGGKVVRLSRATAAPISDQALVGVFMFREAVYEAVSKIRPSERGELEITATLQELIDSGKRVEYLALQGWWKDVGCLEDLLEANRRALDTVEARNDGELINSRVRGRVVISPGAVLENSSVEGPAIIGAGAYLVGAHLRPYVSVGAGCCIEGVKIENCILLSGTTLSEEVEAVEARLISGSSKV